jgi:hypothetical protein
MLDSKEVQEAIDKFRKYVIQQSRSNLSKQKKNVNKSLYNSIKGVSKVNPNSITLYFEMLDYGIFQDKGVSGKVKKYNTDFSYKSKMPPSKVFDKWIVRKGIAPRNEKGQFMSRKSLSYLIARKIFREGIKPSLFFTKPFEKAFDRLPDEIIEAYGIDIVNLYLEKK